MIGQAGPGKPRRTELAVPASNPRFVAKAAASAADLVFLDLEDGVAPDQRAAARQQIIAALHQHDWDTKLRGVRINATSTHWFYDDLITVVEGAGDFIDVIILPKVNLPGDVYMLDTLLTQIETKQGLRRPLMIEAQIETAQGMAHVEQIATASRRLAALIFGPGDFAASVGMPVLEIGAPVPDYPGHLWHAALSRMVVAAKAAGLEALDGPYGAYQDAAGLQRSAMLARALGCDGKWAIHPGQIEPINAVFTPTDVELARAQQIVQRYRAARDGEGRGAVALGGELIDAASLRMAERVLAKGRAAGRI
ncbi:MAG: CoA ester lyase [Chloroflexota bacterium]|nr:CoA ester lyase [Chloroflexota bacterium]